jgi:hypothetical protein
MPMDNLSTGDLATSNLVISPASAPLEARFGDSIHALGT